MALIIGAIIVRIYYTPDWGPNQWGNVGTWLAGIATSLAVIVAVWQTNNANKQARAAEKRADDMQRHTNRERIRQLEFSAVSEIIRCADLAMDSTRRYYETTQATLGGAAGTTEKAKAKEIESNWLDSFTEVFRGINIAILDLETEGIIRASISMTPIIIEIKDTAKENKASSRITPHIDTFLRESMVKVSAGQVALIEAASTAHSSGTVDRVLREMRDELKDKQEAADTKAS